MGLSGDVGVRAHRELRHLAKVSRARRQQLQFAGALHIEQQNTGPEREVDFFGQLADSGENHVARGFPADLLYPLQFTAGDDIESGAQARQQSQDREIGVGLHRVADGVLAAAKGLVKLPVALANRRTRNTRTAECHTARPVC